MNDEHYPPTPSEPDEPSGEGGDEYPGQPDPPEYEETHEDEFTDTEAHSDGFDPDDQREGVHEGPHGELVHTIPPDDEFVPPPPPGGPPRDYFEGDEPPDGPEGTPWERREQIGWIDAFVDSCRMLLFQPSKFFGNMTGKGGLGEALVFFAIFTVAISLFTFPSNLIEAFLLEMTPFGNTGQTIEQMETLTGQSFDYPVWLLIVLSQVCGGCIAPFLAIIGVFISSALFAVVGLFVLGRFDYELCFRVMVFASVAQCSLIINPIPMLREIIVIVHWVVLLTIGFKYVGHVSTGRALLLALSPLLVLIAFFCCCFGSASILGILTASQAM